MEYTYPAPESLHERERQWFSQNLPQGASRRVDSDFLKENTHADIPSVCQGEGLPAPS